MRIIPGRWLATLWMLSGIATMLMLAVAHERVSIRQPTAVAVVAVIVSAGWLRFALRDGFDPARRAARDLAEDVGLFAAISVIGAVASYPVAAASAGFADPMLARADGLIGFDWIGWYAVVASHPVLQWAGAAAYQSIFVSPALLLGYYALTGARATARRFLLAFWAGAVLTLLLFPHLVAMGPLAYLWRGPVPYMPTSALYQERIIPLLRDHALKVVDVGALRGLVSAPSFHTTCGVLYAVHGWRERPLRWSLLGLNAAMLLATPVEGTHYLADMILGAVVAVAALAAASAVSAAASVMARRAPRPRRARLAAR